MIVNLVVIGSIVFGAAFVVAWLVRPDLRAWIESPKHRFQASVRRYDSAGTSRADRPSEPGA